MHTIVFRQNVRYPFHGCADGSEDPVCMQATVAKDDVPVPAPFPDGAASEDALGVTVVSASSSGAQYQSIEQVYLQPTCCSPLMVAGMRHT